MVPTTPSSYKADKIANVGENMPFPWAAVGSGVLQALGTYFSGRRQEREAEKDRELQRMMFRQRTELDRERMAFEKQQYQDELRRLMSLAGTARQRSKELPNVMAGLKAPPPRSFRTP